MKRWLIPLAALVACSPAKSDAKKDVYFDASQRESFAAVSGPSIGLRCILHTDTMTARVDSCTVVTGAIPPAPPPPAPAPPPPPPAPAPAPPPPPPPTAFCGRTSYTRVVNVSTASALHSALAAAKPGDVIVMADDTYSGAGEMRITSGGTASQPISLCGSSKAIIDAGSATGSTTGLSIVNGNYWKLTGFTLQNGLFGIYATKSSWLLMKGLTIHSIGQEGIALKDMSKHDTLTGSNIYDTGKKVAEYGEGIYVGTAGTPTDASDSAVIIGNTFGPNVRAEHADIKEGTHGTIIRHNTFDATGQVESQGASDPVSGWPNSAVILQGMDAKVDSNTVNNAFVAGFRVVYHGTVMTGINNEFSNNTVTGTGSTLYGFLIQAGASTPTNTVACSNKATSVSKGLSNVACK